jgi:hypothetical protein
MNRSLILRLAFAPAFVFFIASTVLAQEGGNTTIYSGQVTSTISAKSTAVQGAPYSATITNESVQTLADGNRIVQTSTGTTARDSQGRTRQDTVLPAIGNLSAANAPHLVFIHDPAAQVSYVLNLTEKTAQKLPMPPPLPAIPAGENAAVGPVTANAFFFQAGGTARMPDELIPPPMTLQRTLIGSDQDQAASEDLGSQTIEGVVVNGKRTTRTIPAGQIGNDKPITIVNEVWTSPDLKTIISSKRSDPRMGEQTFQLTNIVRAEPDASLFTVPADFRITEGPQKIVYRSIQ